MVLETKIEAKIVAGVDKQSFTTAEKYARDTGKRIDEDLKVKMELDIAQAQIKLKSLRKQLRSKDLTDAQRLKLQIDTNKAQRSLTEMKRKLNNLVNTGKTTTSRLKRLFDGVGKNILSSLINPITLAVGALLGLGKALVNAGKTAISFETAFTGVKKTFDAPDEGYAKLDKGLRDLTKRLPLAYEEIAGIAEVSGQLGVEGVDNLIKFTEVAAGLGIATNLSAEEAAQSLKRFSDVLGVPISEIENLGSALVGLGNHFAANEQEILGFAKRMQTAGVVSNLTATDILGISTALVASGISAESGGTSMVKAFDQINTAVAKGGKDLEKFALVAGMSAEEFKKSFSEEAGTTFAKFLEGVNSAGTDAGQVLDDLGIKSSKMRQAFLAAAANSKTLGEALTEANVAFNENAALQDEVNKRLETTEGRLIIAKNKWRDISASIGSFFNKIRVPVFEGITNFLTGLGKYFAIFAAHGKAAFTNLGVAVYNMGATLSNGLNKAKKKFVDFVNGIIKAYNKVAGKLGKDEISIINFEGTEAKAKKAYVSAADSIAAIEKRYEDSSKKQLKLSEEVVRGKIQDEKNLLGELLGLDEKAKSTGGGSSKKTKKAIDDNKEAVKEYDNAVKKMSKSVSSAYDGINKSIEQSVKKQEDLKKAIEDINNDIADVESSTQTDIASRVVEIDVRLKELDTKPVTAEILAEKKALEKEKISAFAGMTDDEKTAFKAQVKEIADYESSTKVEQLKIDRDKKILALEEEKLLKEQQLKEEIAREEELNKQKIALQTAFSKFLEDNVTKELSWIEQLKKGWLEVAAARTKAEGGGGGGAIPGRAAGGPITAGSPYIVGERGPELIVPRSNGQVIPNHNLTVNQNVNANVSNGIDLDNLANQLARKIVLANKGIR